MVIRINSRPPQLTPEERAAALEKALESRRKRMAFKARISSGELSVAEALVEANRRDPTIGKVRVSDFIRAVPGYGNAKAERIMRMLDIASSRRLRGLSDRQVAGLIDVLD